MRPGGLWWTNVLNSALPPQRLRPDTRLQDKDPVGHTAQKKREKRKERKKVIIKYNKMKLLKGKNKNLLK